MWILGLLKNPKTIIYIAIAMALIATGLYIKHLQTKNANLVASNIKLTQAAQILEASLKLEQEKNEKLNKLIELAHKQRIEREKVIKKDAATIYNLKRKYVNVKKILDTKLPNNLLKWLRSRYGYPGKSNKRKTPGLLPKKGGESLFQRQDSRRFTKLHKSSSGGIKGIRRQFAFVP